MPVQTFLCDADLSALDPKTIDPRHVGARAALENLTAFLMADCVRRGDLSRAVAVRGFDRFSAELDALFQPKREG